MGTITLAALKKAIDVAAKKWNADDVEVELDSFADFEETGDEVLHLDVSTEWPYVLILSDTKIAQNPVSPNVCENCNAPIPNTADLCVACQFCCKEDS